MFAASKTAKAASAAAATDPQFNYVTMLLHGDGTNGAQNNTFLDSSTNNFTITRNGNTTQGTFTPYGSNWSNYFNGSSYLTVPSSSAFKPASSDFTIEAWVFVSNTGVLQTVYGDCDSGTNNGMCELSVSSTLKVEVDYFTSSTAVVTKLTTGSIQANAWNHICVSKTGTTMYIGYNGTLETFTGVPSTMQSPATLYPALGRLGAYAGYYINGYISNFRFVVGSAVYTGSTYTVPISPLTAISGTSLLTCQSNRFIDNSSNSFAITTGGSSSVQRFSPFSPTTAYSTSVIGGSGYFDGSGDSLKVTYGSQMNLTNQDFAIEFWLYIPSALSNRSIVCQDQSNYQLNAYVDTSNNLTFYSYQASGTQNFAVAMGSVPVGAWSHFVIARTSSTVAGFRNGTRIATATFSGSVDAQTGGWYLGAVYSNLNQINGYLSDVRFVIGSNPYGVGTTLTIPTAPLTAVTNTQFLASFTNAGILDNAMMNDLETVGNAQISTSVKKYGTGSISFDGTDDRLTSATSPNIAFGTGDFTVEAWIYTNTLSGERGFIQTSATMGGLQTSYTNGIVIIFDASPNLGRIVVNVGGTNLNSGTTLLSTGVWYHLALTRSSGSVRLFINGTVVGGPTTITANLTGQNIVIGGYYSTTYLWNGYIDDLRITKGFARYTANFTPPTAAFPNN